MARKDVVQFVCDHCGTIVEDEMCCEEPMHGYPKMWSSVSAGEANYNSNGDNSWHDLCPRCSEAWNLMIRGFFVKGQETEVCEDV